MRLRHAERGLLSHAEEFPTLHFPSHRESPEGETAARADTKFVDRPNLPGVMARVALERRLAGWPAAAWPPDDGDGRRTSRKVYDFNQPEGFEKRHARDGVGNIPMDGADRSSLRLFLSSCQTLI